MSVECMLLFDFRLLVFICFVFGVLVFGVR